MLKSTGMALVLAVILALGAICPAVAEDGDGLFIEGQWDVLPELAAGDGLALDLSQDSLKRFDVEASALPEGTGRNAVASSGISAADHNAAHSPLDTDGLPVIEADVATPAEDCVMLGLSGSYVTDVANALARINEIRLEACREGVDNPDNPGTPLTMNDYVPIKWSSDLEYIARIRAAEASITIAHERLNGRFIFGLNGPGGAGSWGEVIAWNWSKGVIMGINQWYGEKADWINKTGAVTGHYTQMISPGHTYVGLGTFCCGDAVYYNTTVGEFSFESGLNETPMGFSGSCVQKLEVQNARIEGGALVGTMRGVSGDTAGLALSVSVMGGKLRVINGVSWSSASPTVASVDANGTVTAVSCGVAAITANAPGVASATAEFTVNHLEEALPAVTATCTEAGLTAGVKCPVCGDILEAQQPVPALGHAFGPWTTTRQATVFQTGTRQRVCGTCGLREDEDVPALTPELTLSSTAVTLAKTKARSVRITVAAGDSFKARSSDSKIVKVARAGDSVTVTARKKAGTAFVTVETKSGLKGVIEVTVSPAQTKKITCKAVTVKKGKKVTLKPQVTPAYSDDPITFQSADTRIATVTSKGVVKGVRKGKTTITVRSGNKSVKVKVTVK